MEDDSMDGEMSPAAGALGLLRKKRANLGMMNPATTNKEGTEFMVDKAMVPANLKPGQTVCVTATVTKVGSQVSMAPTKVELEDAADTNAEVDESEEASAPAPAKASDPMDRLSSSSKVKY